MASEIKGRKELELEQRKAFILARAEELFAELGYDNTSMAMIADKSEFAVGTVYNLFPSKNDIYLEIVLLKLNEIKNGFCQIAGIDSSPKEKIKSSIKFLFDFFAVNEKFIRIYLGELTHLGWGLPTNLGENVREVLYEGMGFFTAFIIEGQKNGDIKSDVDNRKITIIFTDILKSYLCFWINLEKSSDLCDSADEMYDIFMNGIGA